MKQKQQKQSQRKPVELPHGALLDPETQIVSLQMGQYRLKLPVDQLEELAEMVDDILTVLASVVQVTESHCPTCGSVNSTIEIKDPDEFGPN